MKSKDKLISDIKDDPRVKRIKELEDKIDANSTLRRLLNEKKQISKQMVLAREVGLTNTYNQYKERYDQIDEEIAAYPFVEEYMDLLEDTHNDLEIMVSYLEKNINNHLI